MLRILTEELIEGQNGLSTLELYYLQNLQSLEQGDKRIVVIFVSKIAESASKNSLLFVSKFLSSR